MWVRIEDGRVAEQTFTPPEDAGEDWHNAERRGDLMIEDFVPGTGWVKKGDEYRQACLYKVDAMRRALHARDDFLPHRAKQVEVSAYRAGATHRESTPWLHAEADALGKDVSEVVASVEAAMDVAHDAMIQKEAASIRAKRDLEAAVDAAEMDAIMAALDEQYTL